MPTIQDTAFSIAELSVKLSQQPKPPTTILSSGIFEVDSTHLTTVQIEREDGVIGLVATSPRGGPGQTIGKGSRSLRSLVVPHVQLDGGITADAVQNARKFGTTDETESVTDALIKSTGTANRNLTFTEEHFALGAIKGIVSDKSGVLYNLYTEFGLTEPTATEWDLASSSFKPKKAAKDVADAMEEELDDVNSGIVAFCGVDFFDKILMSPDYLEIFKYNNFSKENLVPMPDEVSLWGITWKKYKMGKKAKAAAAGANAIFIARDEAHLAFRGVPDLFKMIYAPADYNDTVNTLGLPRYMHTWERDDRKGMEWQIQTNPLALCSRPETLKKLKLKP